MLQKPCDYDKITYCAGSVSDKLFRIAFPISIKILEYTICKKRKKISVVMQTETPECGAVSLTM